MQIDVFTLFPEWFEWFGEQRHMKNLFEPGTRSTRWTCAPRRRSRTIVLTTRRMAGGAGNGIRVDVVEEALGRAIRSTPLSWARSAGCRAFSDRSPARRSTDRRTGGGRDLTMLCGRYEGFDQRVHDHFATDVMSIGDYVLSGGELAAMVSSTPSRANFPRRMAMSAAPRKSRSAPSSTALLSTRTTRVREEYRGWRVPDVLLSGHHGEIERWRREQSESRRAALESSRDQQKDGD